MTNEAAAPDVLVLGGGLAGLAAAVRLAEHGRRVTLLEARDRLGGRAGSFRDAVTGAWIDACQHVVMRGCTNYLDLLQRLEASDQIAWWDTLWFTGSPGRRHAMRRGLLPAPWHLAGSLLRWHGLGLGDRYALARGMSQIVRSGPRGRPALAGESFAAWLERQRQPAAAIDRFWSVVTVSALNESVASASAAYAAQVFQQGFLAHRDACEVGVPKVPLVELYRAAGDRLAWSGGTIELGATVRGLAWERGRIAGVTLGDGRTRTAACYVSALPFAQLARVAPPELTGADRRLAHLGEFRSSPILGIHLWYRPALLDASHLIFTDSPLQWVFDKGVVPGRGEQHLVVVISAAQAWIDQAQEVLLAMATSELSRHLGPAALTPTRSQVIKERHATFSARPGIDAIRPAAAGATANLFLAGDWCATGWPATMEGAVRSGYLAAEAITGTPMLAPEAPVGRWLRRRRAWRQA
jgi:zeta-carotene desaturase